MNLRRPTEKLSGCVWLPRFIDKARHHFAGTLAQDYEQAFCHPLGTDTVFLSHFEIEKAEILQVIRDSDGNAEAIARWFQARPKYSPEKVAAWNELAPNLGKEGYPVRRGFRWVIKHYYGDAVPDPRVDGVFTVIAYDEGYLDEL